MNQYLQIKKTLLEQLKKYPYFVADSKESYKKGMQKLGYTMQQNQEQYVGEFCHVRKCDLEDLVHITETFYEKVYEQIKKDQDFAKDYFLYALLCIMDTIEDPMDISLTGPVAALMYDDISPEKIAVDEKLPDTVIHGFVEAQDIIFEMLN